VDFYSGIILQALGIPSHLFTVIFALARTVGWIAQWNEMIEDPHQKIGGSSLSLALATNSEIRSTLPISSSMWTTASLAPPCAGRLICLPCRSVLCHQYFR
jgi:hypothetical protein